MDDDNTTPESNVPEENSDSNPQTVLFDNQLKDSDKYGKTHYQGNKRAYNEHEGWYGRKNTPHTPPFKKEPPSVYDEILEDLIDIVAKLLKELGKRK